VKRDDGLSGPIFHGHLCGTLSDHVVILEGDTALPFEKGERILVHTNLRGQAIGFVSTVLSRASEPSPHFYLNVPDDYEEIELRRAARVPALIPVRIELGHEPQVTQGGDGVEGVLINLSRSGCAVSSLEAFGPNDELILNVTLPGQAGQYRLNITIVSHQDDDKVHVHGARFQPGDQVRESLRGLQEWIARQTSFWPAGQTCRRAI
jgi:hypothetical protein